jgi:hypothetical protein
MMPFIEAGNTPSASLTPSEWNFSPLVTPASLKYSPLEQQNILFSKLYFLEFVSFFFLFLLIDIFTNSPFS